LHVIEEYFYLTSVTAWRSQHCGWCCVGSGLQTYRHGLHVPEWSSCWEDPEEMVWIWQTEARGCFYCD